MDRTTIDRTTMGTATTAAIAIALAIVSATARADVPREVTIEAEVTDDHGVALEGEHRIHLRLYAGGLALVAQDEVALAEHGRVVATLEPPARVFESGSGFEIGIAIDGDPEMTPRIAIGSVPFALVAEHAVSAASAASAETAAHADLADHATIADRALVAERAETADRVGTLEAARLQARLAGECPVGSSLRAIGGDGAITCEVDDVGPSYGAGSGITLTGGRIAADTTFVQRRVAGSCPAGQAIRAIDVSGHVTCERIPAPRAEAVTWVNRIANFGTTSAALGSTTNRVCFLTSVGMRELDVTEDQAECRIRASGGQWYVDAVLGLDPESGAGTDAYVTCRASCLAW